jgi:hypothetical protein
MNQWRNMTLGDFVALQRGHDLTEPQRRIGCVPVLGSAGQNGFHDTALAKGPGIVIGRSGASFGQVHFSKEDFWPHNTGLYVTDFKGNDPLFAFYFLKALDFDRFNSGSAQPSLNRNFIYPIPIRVPKPVEQKAIAAVVGALDDITDFTEEEKVALVEACSTNSQVKGAFGVPAAIKRAFGKTTLAERQSLHHNTILILELAGHLLPDELLSLYAEKFQSGDFRFQTLLVNHSERPQVDWTGWSVARFSGKPPRVRIEQNRINEETRNPKAAPSP